MSSEYMSEIFHTPAADTVRALKHVSLICLFPAHIKLRKIVNTLEHDIKKQFF